MEEKYNRPLEELFTQPPNEFRMMPFWFWNHEMVEKEVQRQIRDHNEHGIGGEFIHPRHGRLTPYMGKRWLQNVEAAADQCKALGMPCFLYDEDNWPSGPVSGKITGPDHPENRAKFLVLFDEDVFEGKQQIEYELDYKKISPETKFYAAIAVPNPEKYPSFADVYDKWQDISSNVVKDKLIWDVPEGEWCVLLFCICVNEPDSNMNGYIDPLRKETVQQFIELTHKKYIDYFISRGKKDYIGKIIPGIFTDEPSMYHVDFAGREFFKYYTFTTEFPKRFKEMHGYDFNECLVSLFYDTGDIATKYRCHYWDTLTAMYVDAFYKQIYEYCDKYNFRTTGHVNAEGSWPSHFKNQGDFFKVFQYMHYGGVDQLTEEVRPDYYEDLWNMEKDPYSGMAYEMLVASKMASSAAHLLGKPRVLVEAFGTSSWDITLASAKRVNDYLIATGCDLFVPHDFAYSEDGYRKQDHPASFYHQPYYVHWKKLCDHNARLSTILNAHSGYLQPEVLMLYPTNTMYSEFQPNDTNYTTIISRTFIHGADCFFRQQLDFELANEDMITWGIVEKNKIKIKQEYFKLLYIGSITTISLDFAQFMKKFYDNGGKILASMILPFKDKNKGYSEEICTIMKEIFGIHPKEHYDLLNRGKIKDWKLIEHVNKNGGQAILIQTELKIPYLGAYYPLFEEACRKLLPLKNRDVIAWKDEKNQKHAAYIMKTHKNIDSKDFFFLANTSRDANYKNCKVIFDCVPKRLELWDTLTGEIKLINNYGIKDQQTILELDFPPYKSYLFRIEKLTDLGLVKDKSLEKDKSKLPKDPIEAIELPKGWTCKLNSPNGAMLNEDWHSKYHVEAGKAWGYPSERIFTHKFNISGVEDIKPLKLVIEGLVGDYGWGKTTYMELKGGDSATFNMHGLEFYVNNKKLDVKFDFEYVYLDPCWIVVDISKEIIEGMNEVKMICRTRNEGTFHVVTDPWRLIGPFEMEMKDGIPYLKKARKKVDIKDLCEQGFARFHGGFSYSQEWFMHPKFKNRRIILDIEGCTDCIEVVINGELVDVMWNNWTVDITSALNISEKNTIELIYYGIAQNMLQTNLKPTGIIGKVSLKIYQ